MSPAECTDAPVIASGGVSSLDDLRAMATLTDSGVEGAIVGKALYAGLPVPAFPDEPQDA